MDNTILRTRLIRLASKHPEFRKDLLPLLSKKASQYDPQAELSEQMDRITREVSDILLNAFDSHKAKINDIRFRGDLLEVRMHFDVIDMETDVRRTTLQDYADVFSDLNPLVEPASTKFNAHGQDTVVATWFVQET